MKGISRFRLPPGAAVPPVPGARRTMVNAVHEVRLGAALNSGGS